MGKMGCIIYLFWKMTLPGFRTLLPPGDWYGQLDSNPDSDSKQLDSDSDSDSRKKEWIRIQLDSDSRCLDSDPDSDSRSLDSHITDIHEYGITLYFHKAEFSRI